MNLETDSQRFWRTSELVDLLCKEASQGSLFSLALTSRNVSEHALDSLWRHLYSFEPLLACLPDDLWREKEVTQISFEKPVPVLFPRRAIAPEELDRYRSFYASRIRTIALSTVGDVLLSFDALSALFTVSTLLGPDSLAPPKLQTLRLFLDPAESIHNFAMVTFLPIFVGKAEMEISTAMQAARQDVGLVELAMEGKANLKTLAVSAYSRTEYGGGELWGFIRSQSWDTLESLTLPELPPIAFLGALPKLKHLSAAHVAEIAYKYVPIEARNSWFPCLEELSLEAESFAPICAFIKQLAPTNQIRTATFSASNPAPALDVQQLIDTVQKHMRPDHLEGLELSNGDLTDEQIETLEPGPPEPEEPIDMEFPGSIDITSLRRFSKLSMLLVNTRQRVQMSSHDLSAIPLVWPAMVSLDFCETALQGGTPLVDHTDVLHLVERLPALRWLGLPFDATRVRGTEESARGPHHVLEMLRVRGSPIASPSLVRTFMRRNFPNAKVDSRYSDPRLNHVGMYPQRWVVVEETLRRM
ncbi:hypothetical protein D9611_005372 [Ephemerocybe angulata]|uniref:F-box domain-containing protein n=1 Tax=Ephemerocybe angulata TaxID=980116 RepID=A0A8H5C097_9AGAR|nr:hypothetical protein D9611_005372 [Tulosesus angulatus]